MTTAYYGAKAKEEERPSRMNLLIIDATNSVDAVLAPHCSERSWTVKCVANPHDLYTAIADTPPDMVIVHGDGAGGEAAHTCQRLKQNVLTAGIPIVLFEDASPPAWMLAGLPADAILQAPWDVDEFFHQVSILIPGQEGTATLDDLTNFPRRTSVIEDMQRRVVGRELFGVGILNLREADAYRQDFGRSGLDQFVVLVSVLLRRHAAGSVPISVGHLDDGNFLVLGPSTTVQEVIAQTTYEFDSLVPAYYEMDTLFGADDSHDVGPSTWIALQGGVCLVEPGGYENIWQIGYKLADTLTSGAEALQLVSMDSIPEDTAKLMSSTR
jgi:GGDEF domain-containing protein